MGVADRVQIVGLVAHEAIPGLVAGFDIALQPRVVAYASPLKLFEYMAAGKAIVAPDQPNIREVLVDGETALLFDPAASDTMWTAIRRARGGPASTPGASAPPRPRRSHDVVTHGGRTPNAWWPGPMR